MAENKINRYHTSMVCMNACMLACRASSLTGSIYLLHHIRLSAHTVEQNASLDLNNPMLYKRKENTPMVQSACLAWKYNILIY
jgi:hypothetical protein